MKITIYFKRGAVYSARFISFKDRTFTVLIDGYKTPDVFHTEIIDRITTKPLR